MSETNREVSNRVRPYITSGAKSLGCHVKFHTSFKLASLYGLDDSLSPSISAQSIVLAGLAILVV